MVDGFWSDLVNVVLGVHQGSVFDPQLVHTTVLKIKPSFSISLRCISMLHLLHKILLSKISVIGKTPVVSSKSTSLSILKLFP